MNGTPEQRQRMHMLPRMIPEQIIAGEILQMPRLELEQRILTEFEQNPALAMEEVGLCPVCDAPADRFPCPNCGYLPCSEDVPVVMADDWEAFHEYLHDAESLEPFGTVAERESLRDSLHRQWMMEDGGADGHVGRFLIDCVNEDGYLTEPLIEVAQRFRMSVPQVEAVLLRVQELDPPGIAARDLRECLQIQCSRMGSEAPAAETAARLIEDAWEPFSARKYELCARALGVEEDRVREAAVWLRDHLSPYPGRAYRASWNNLAPREEPEVAPDVVIRIGESGFIVEIVESSRLKLGIDPEYRRIQGALGRRTGNWRPEWDHVRRAVSNAHFLMDAIAQRRRTLYTVMSAVAEAQRGFLLRGPAHLKPLMQKTIAQQVGIHESSVCRALADKLVRIPSGETIPSTRFFDDSAPVKEALQTIIAREDTARPLSDSRLAALLAENGHPVARRTVAKYRDALGIPAVEHRTR